MIADFFDFDDCFLFAACAVLSRSMSASVSPAPNAPIWRKSRRVAPSQNLWDEPRNRSMTWTLERTQERWGGTRLRELAGDLGEAGHRDRWGKAGTQPSPTVIEYSHLPEVKS